jgi:ferredoxin
VCPKFWELLTDGASNIKGGKVVRKNWQVLEIEEKDYKCNLKAARSCTVNVIHLSDLKLGKKII